VIDDQPLKNDRYRIPKSRYDSVDLYISTDERNLPEYHDIDVPMDQGVRKRLIDHGNPLPLLLIHANANYQDWTTRSHPILPTYSSVTPSSNSARLSSKMILNQWIISRISNRQTGRLFDSNHLLSIHLLVGESNLGVWKSK
jgi:hypothetical protein